jgi:hypothetical protein
MREQALLSLKFGKFISSIEDIEDIHVHDIDGDSMSIDVVYCSKENDTCIAVEVPIRFPHHCDTEEEIDDAIHELEVSLPYHYASLYCSSEHVSTIVLLL